MVGVLKKKKRRKREEKKEKKKERGKRGKKDGGVSFGVRSCGGGVVAA
jgi:hypothetical protein